MHRRQWRQEMLVIMSDERWDSDPQKLSTVQHLAKLIQRNKIPSQLLQDLTLADYISWLANGHKKAEIAKQHDVSQATLGRYIKKLRS